MKSLGCFLLIGCLFLFQGCGQSEPPASADGTKTGKVLDVEAAAELITAQGIMASVKTLSDDAMEGRGTGTAGERKAADWIAEQFSSHGLKPMGADYFQKVELVGFKKDPETSTLTLTGPDGEIAYENEKTLTYWSSSQKEKVSLTDAKLLFVGYGVEAPEYNWDDFKGVDTQGKILVFLNNDPNVEGEPEAFGGEARTYYGRWTYKFEQAMRKGAAGAIMIHTTPSAGYWWSVIGNAGLNESFSMRIPDTGYQLDLLAWMHIDLATVISKYIGETEESLFAKANKRDFQPMELPVTLSTEMNITLRNTDSQNVIGVWEGSDPQLKDEYVLFSAHYDHLGKKDEGEGDLIYNGAWDNGSGTASIIEIAKAFSKSGIRPKRSVAFVACAAEERGLLGSQYFVAKPPVELKRIVANLNVDMVQIFGMTRDVVAIGHDANSLGAALKRLTDQATAPGPEGTPVTLALKGDQNPNAGSFYRSDQVSFAKAGIPALFMLPGTDFVDTLAVDPAQYRTAHYHQLADEVNEHWNLAGCERDMRITFKLALETANGPMPTWNPGNEFENTWKALHGK